MSVTLLVIPVPDSVDDVYALLSAALLSTASESVGGERVQFSDKDRAALVDLGRSFASHAETREATR